MRLIDADELIKKIDFTINCAAEMKRNTFELKGLKKIICDIPTVYDVDKVVKEIEDYSFRAFGEIRTENVIEIVKVGGKNE